MKRFRVTKLDAPLYALFSRPIFLSSFVSPCLSLHGLCLLAADAVLFSRCFPRDSFIFPRPFCPSRHGATLPSPFRSVALPSAALPFAPLISFNMFCSLYLLVLYRRLSFAHGVLFTPYISSSLSFRSLSGTNVVSRFTSLSLSLFSLPLPLTFSLPINSLFPAHLSTLSPPHARSLFSLILLLYKVSFLSSSTFYINLSSSPLLSFSFHLYRRSLFLDRLLRLFRSPLHKPTPLTPPVLSSTLHSFFFSLSLQLALALLPSPIRPLFVPSSSTVHPRWLGARAEH